MGVARPLRKKDLASLMLDRARLKKSSGKGRFGVYSGH